MHIQYCLLCSSTIYLARMTAPTMQIRGYSAAGRRIFHTAPFASLPHRVQSSRRHHNPQRSQRLSESVCRTGSVVCRADNNAHAQQFDVDAPKSSEPRLEFDAPRDDEVLPEDLADAISQAAAATAEAIRRGNTRCQVEILLPEFWDPISGPIFPNRGDQDRFWRITRRFVELLGTSLGMPHQQINAVYPDAGVAAMLSYQWTTKQEDSPPDWTPAEFRLTSLNDRRPIQAQDQLVIMACPDPPGADDAVKIIRQVSQQDEDSGTPERPIVLFNQRLSSGDVGLGLNARRLRDQFLKNFSVTYSLRPIGDIGSVYRRYPGQWQVFLEDPELPGRYKLIAEKPSRPQGEYLDYLVQQALGGGQDQAEGQEGGAGSFLGQVQRTMNSLSYFMRSLTK